MIDISMLNESQRAAVEWRNEPLLVLAGPGSGKTRVLTMRVAKLLDESAGQNFRILALTFTNKAAGEMRSRVESLVPNEMSRVRMTTFHSYAAEILQQYGSNAGIRPDFQILTNEADRKALLQDVLYTAIKGSPAAVPEYLTVDRLLPLVNQLLERCVSGEDVLAELQSAKVENAELIAQIYCAYRKSLKERNALDFPSLIMEALELLKKFPKLTTFIRRVYKHVLIDEFQDTNLSQYKLLKEIVTPDPKTLFVVADDDQIIYQWNGASPERLRSLQNDFNMRVRQLPENYRCPPHVVELANRLIQHNQNRSEKDPLRAMKSLTDEDVVRVRGFDDFDDEISWVAQDILERPECERTRCVVLARTKRMLDEIGECMMKKGLDAYVGARKDEFVSAPMRMLYSILRLANSNSDKAALANLIKAFHEVVGTDVDLAQIVTSAESGNKDLIRAWMENVASMASCDSETRDFVGVKVEAFLKNTSSFEVFAGKLFDWYESKVEMTESEESSIYNEEKRTWNEIFIDISKQHVGEDIGLYQFMHELDLRSKVPARREGARPCFTIHTSKGMEFGHVYLIGMVEDQLPSWGAVRKGDSSSEIQEERRDCFVAITRAQQSLTMTYSNALWGWRKKPSRFLREMGCLGEMG